VLEEISMDKKLAMIKSSSKKVFFLSTFILLMLCADSQNAKNNSRSLDGKNVAEQLNTNPLPTPIKEIGNFFKFDGDSLEYDVTFDLASQLVPLDSIIQIALLNSPTMEYGESAVKKYKYNLKHTKNMWTNGVSVFYNYGFGNQAAFLSSSDASGVQQLNNLGVGYRAGVNVTFGMGEIFARPLKNKEMEAELEMAKNKYKEFEVAIRRQIIADYYSMIAYQRIFKVRVSDAESARLSTEIATVEMKMGKIHPSELSRLKNILAIAETNVEDSKKDFLTAYYQLEALVGQNLTSLKRK